MAITVVILFIVLIQGVRATKKQLQETGACALLAARAHANSTAAASLLIRRVIPADQMGTATTLKLRYLMLPGSSVLCGRQVF